MHKRQRGMVDYKKAFFAVMAAFMCLFAPDMTAQASKKAEIWIVKGCAIEKDSREAIPYATVTLQYDSAKTVVKRVATDAKGKFEVEAQKTGKYSVILSAVGYANTLVKCELTAEVRKLDIGDISMPEGVQLQEVVVEAQKPLIKSDLDKLTYNMDADPEAQNNNTLEMLRKVPMITVDGEENITLKGQSNFKVLLNGKNSTMLSGNLKQVLKSMPASSIKSIEVITNPSSKYDAEGIGGVINIITVRKSLNGLIGNVSLNADNYGSVGGSAYLSSKINKFGFSMRYFGNGNRSPQYQSESSRTNYMSDDYYKSLTNGISRNKGMGNHLSAEASYEVDTFNLVTFSVGGYLGNGKGNGSTRTLEYNKAEELSRDFNNTYRNKYSYGNVSASLDYQRTFMKPDRSFTVSYKIDYQPTSSDYYTDILSYLNYEPYKNHSVNDAYGSEQTFQLDYYDPLSKMHQIEGGVKYILRLNNSESDIRMFDDNLQEWIQQTNRMNDLDYTQHILGLYGGYMFKWKSFGTKAGFRIESTWNDGVFKSLENTTFTNKLFNIVPYLTLTYKLTDQQNLKLSYTQRLSRPGIWHLNPYVNDLNPLDISYGNPNLESEIAHSFSFDYGYYTQKYNLSASLSTVLLNNGIEGLSWIDAKGVRKNTYDNIGHRRNYGLYLFGSARFTKKFSLYLNGGANYTQVQASGNKNSGAQVGNLSNSGFNFNGNLGLNWFPWKDASIYAGGGMFSSNVMLQGKRSAYYYTNIGVTQYFLKRKLSVGLSVSDPFEKRKHMWQRFHDITYEMQTDSWNSSRRFRISIAYNFGKMGQTVKKVRRGINNDDLKSGSGQGSTQ